MDEFHLTKSKAKNGKLGGLVGGWNKHKAAAVGGRNASSYLV